MAFVDFQIRAWRADGDRVAVLVHSSPAGDLSRPLVVPVDFAELARLRGAVFEPDPRSDARSTSLQAVGELLSRALLPPPVSSLLLRSLERVPAGGGLRVRLCLDSALIDLPWETLVRPDATEMSSLEAFLALDPRISLVRGAPLQARNWTRSTDRQRLAFVGLLYPTAEKDMFRVRDEYRSLEDALASVDDLLAVDGFRAATDAELSAALSEPAAVFHYAGHADVQGGKGALTMQSDGGASNERFSTDVLAPLLQRAQTQLAVLSACNSGAWPVVRPLVRAGIPAIVGVQGAVAVDAALAFCGKLYAALALGLSLDEAVTWARLCLLEDADHNYLAPSWPSMMVYLSGVSAVLLPRPHDSAVRARQERLRDQRQQTIINVTQNIGAIHGGTISGVAAGSIAGVRPAESSPH